MTDISKIALIGDESKLVKVAIKHYMKCKRSMGFEEKWKLDKIVDKVDKGLEKHRRVIENKIAMDVDGI